MGKYYGDVCVSTGVYQGKDGKEKKRWVKLGGCFIDEQNRISIKLEALPMPKMDNNGFPCSWLSVFQKDASQNTSQQPSQGGFPQSDRGDISSHDQPSWGNEPTTFGSQA